jgi:Putative zinc-finger
MTNSNMTCEAFDAALPDYLEGTLDNSLRAAAQEHLRECVRCTSLLRDIENIRNEAAALPELVPSRDLWQGIEGRIIAPVIPLASRPERQRRFAPAWMGVAAAALIVSTAGITYMLTVRTFRPAGGGTVAQIAPRNNRSQSNVGPDSGVSPVSTQASSGDNSGTSTTPDAGGVRIPARLVNQTTAASRQQSDLIYRREIDMLQKIVSQRETQLDSSTVAIIRKNLQIIDTAIEQSRAALARDPASRMLDQQLTHALDKKVELLRTAAMLRART